MMDRSEGTIKVALTNEHNSADGLAPRWFGTAVGHRHVSGLNGSNPPIQGLSQP